MKKLAIAITTLFILSGCSLFGGDGGGNMSSSGGASPEVQAAISEAEAAIEKARSVDGEWRDSVKQYLKKAKAAAAKGDNKKALELAKKAKFEGEMGYQQAVAQKNAGPWLF